MKIQSLKCSLKALYPAWGKLALGPHERQVRLQEPPAAESRSTQAASLIDWCPLRVRNQVLSMMALSVDL